MALRRKKPDGTFVPGVPPVYLSSDDIYNESDVTGSKVSDALETLNNGKVAKTTTVNGKALSANVSLDGTDIYVDGTAQTPVTMKAKVEEQSEQIVTLQQCGLTVVNGELNMTYEEA